MKIKWRLFVQKERIRGPYAPRIVKGDLAEVAELSCRRKQWATIERMHCNTHVQEATERETLKRWQMADAGAA